MKRKRHLILLAIITTLSFCGCGKESVEKAEPAQDESPATTYTVIDESDAKPETSPVDIPLEVTFQTKKCENYESESVMYFYFKIKNISGSALCFLCEIYCVLGFLWYNKVLQKIRLHFYQTYITIMLHKN